MKEKEIKVKTRELVKNLSHRIELATGIVPLIIDEKSTVRIFRLLKKDKKLGTVLSQEELFDEASFLSSLITVKKLNPLQRKEAIKKRIEELKSAKEYIGYVLLDGLHDLPLGTKIGNLEIIDKQSLGDQFKYFNNQTEKFGADTNSSFAKITFKAHRMIGAEKILVDELELPFAILSLIFEFEMNPRNISAILWYPNNWPQYLEPYSKRSGWVVFKDAVHQKPLELLSKISTSKSKNELQKRIIRSLKIFGISRATNITELRFIPIIAAIEALLLQETDRETLGMKFAQKITVILGKNFSNYRTRYLAFKEYKKLYVLRSKFIHDGKNIDKHSLELLNNIFYSLIIKISGLSNKLHCIDDLDNFINEKLFGKLYSAD